VVSIRVAIDGNYFSWIGAQIVDPDEANSSPIVRVLQAGYLKFSSKPSDRLSFVRDGKAGHERFNLETVRPRRYYETYPILIWTK